MYKDMQILNSLKSYFNLKPPVLAGLHIGASSLKLLCLSKTGERFQIEHYANVPLPSGAVLEKEIKDSAAITHAIKQLIAQTRGAIKHVAIALPDNAIISKTIQMDASLSEMQLEELIQFEAEQHLPHPLEEVSLDFQVTGINAKNSQLIDVLLVASHKKNVESRVEAITAGGLQVKAVDVESYAIERACQLLREQWPERGNQQTIVIFVLSALVLTLVVLHDNNVIFTRSENFGSEQLTQSIQQRYNLSYEEAEQAKLNNTLPADYVTSVLQPFEELVLLQIRRLLQFFFSASHYSEINHFVLAGGSAQLPGLAERITEQLNVQVVVANPFADMIIAPGINTALLNQEAPGLLLCTGLALRNFGG